MASLLHTSIFLISSDGIHEVWIFADKGYHGAGVRVNPASKGCRLNFGDEAMIEIITDIRHFTERSKRGTKARERTQTRKFMPDGEHDDH